MPKLNDYVKFKEYVHPTTGIKVKIEVHKKQGEFRAEYQGEVIREEKLPVLESKLYQLIKDSLSIKWVDVIEVETNRNDNLNRHTVSLDIKHQQVAMVAGKWKIREFPGKRTDLGQQMYEANPLYGASEWYRGPHSSNAHLALPLTLPYHYAPERTYYENRELYYLAYSDALWAGLSELQTRLDQLYKQLQTILGSEELVGRVAQLGASMLNLLPSPGGEYEITGYQPQPTPDEGNDPPYSGSAVRGA